MKAIKEINYRRLNNGDFYQFIDNIVSVVNADPATRSISNILKEDVLLLQISFKKEQLTQETKKIIELDNLRDRAFLKLKSLIEAYQYDDETPANRKASEDLQVLIKRFGAGKIIKFDYNKETATLSNFINDARGKFSKQLETLNLTASLNYLELSNTDFKNFYATRNDAAADLANVIPFSRLRTQVNEHYKNFVTDLESLQRFIPEQAPKIEAVIDRVNIEIDKFKLLIKNAPPATPEVK